jgi:metal-responsive CopG/Arc/MetJ family transcriptional regulator
MATRTRGMRNVPMFYNEVKQSFNAKLTPTMIQKLDSIATDLNISKSEVIERLLRANIDHREVLRKQQNQRL